jgi:hypothetical protein
MTGWTTYTVHVDGRRVIPVSHDAVGTTQVKSEQDCLS